MNDVTYIKPVKKTSSGYQTVDADWDGTSSDWFEMNPELPIKGFLFKGLVTGDLTFHVSDTAAGTDAYLLGIAEDLTGKVNEVAIFLPEAAPFRYGRWTSTGTQVNGVIKMIESS